MVVVLVFEEKAIRAICAHAVQVRRSDCEKDLFYNEIASEWDLQNPGEMILGQRDYNGHVGERIDGFECVHERNVKGRRQFCDEKWLCVASTWFEKEQKKISYSMSGNETEIDFVLVGKKQQKSI